MDLNKKLGIVAAVLAALAAIMSAACISRQQDRIDVLEAALETETAKAERMSAAIDQAAREIQSIDAALAAYMDRMTAIDRGHHEKMDAIREAARDESVRGWLDTPIPPGLLRAFTAPGAGSPPDSSAPGPVCALPASGRAGGPSD